MKGSYQQEPQAAEAGGAVHGAIRGHRIQDIRLIRCVVPDNENVLVGGNSNKNFTATGADCGYWSATCTMATTEGQYKKMKITTGQCFPSARCPSAGGEIYRITDVAYFP